MNTFSKLLAKYPLPISLISVALTVFFAAGLPKIELSRAVDETTLPKDNAVIQAIRTVKGTFGDDSRQVILSIKTKNDLKVSHPEVLSAIRDLSQRLVDSTMTNPGGVISITLVQDYKTVDDELIATPIVSESMTDTAEIDEALQSNEFVAGRLVSPDLKSTLIVAAIPSKIDHENAHNTMEAIKAPYVDSEFVAVTTLGSPEVNYVLHKGIEEDTALFIVLSILLIIAAFLALFRTWQGVLVPLTSIVFAIIWVMGAVGYYGEPIIILSATLPVVVVVVASSCVLHVYHSLMHEWVEGISFQLAFERVLKRLLSPLAMAMLTTFLGGATLLAFKIYPMRHFGIFTAFTAAVSLFISVGFVPALMVMIQKPRKKDIAVIGKPKRPRGLDRVLGQTVKMSFKHPYWVVGFTVGAIASSAYYSAKLDVGFDNIDFLPKNTSIRGAVNELREAFGGMRTFEVLVDTGKPGGALDPQLIKNVTTFEERAAALPKINHTMSIVHYLKRVHIALADNEKTAGPMPEDANALAQYLLLMDLAGAGKITSKAITPNQQKLKISLKADLTDTKDRELYLKKLETIASETFGPEVKVTLGGSLLFDVVVMRYLVWGKIQNMLLAILVIFVALLLRYQSIARALITVLPLPVGVLFNFGLMGFLGIRLDFVSAIVTSFVMGVGIDFSIHFVAAVKKAYPEEKSLRKSVTAAAIGPGRAIVYSAGCTIAGFAVPLFSKFAALNTFAILVCFNMIVVLVATFVLIPAFMRIFQPKFIFVGTQMETFQNVQQGGQPMILNIFKYLFSGLAVLALFIGVLSVDAEGATGPSADEILSKAERAGYANHEESTYVMRLIGKGGDEGVRKMKVYFKSTKADDFRLMIRFIEPANIRGTGFLTVKKGGRTDQWLYLPALRKTRRVAGGGNSSESFLGSDFSVGDISVDQSWNFKKSGIKPCARGKCYVLTGKPSGGSDYSKKVMWVDTKTFLNMKTEYFNRQGQKAKQMIAGSIYKEGGRWLMKSIEMKNLLTGHKTILEYTNRNTKKAPSDRVFTKSFLKKI